MSAASRSEALGVVADQGANMRLKPKWSEETCSFGTRDGGLGGIDLAPSSFICPLKHIHTHHPPSFSRPRGMPNPEISGSPTSRETA